MEVPALLIINLVVMTMVRVERMALEAMGKVFTQMAEQMAMGLLLVNAHLLAQVFLRMAQTMVRVQAMELGAKRLLMDLKVVKICIRILVVVSMVVLVEEELVW